MKRYSSTTYDYAEQDDLVGSPNLDRPIRLTRFPTMAATKKKDMRLSLRQLAALIERTEADDKAGLPWFKMAVFGSNRAASPSGHSYRSNANVVTVSGIEADYDGEEIMPEDARDMLAEADMVATVYATPSHSPDAPRWRVFAPFSEELLPDVRERHMARLNGIFGRALDDASFTLSQSYYGGNVTGRPKVTTFLVDGRYFDTASDLDAGARWKRGRTKTANDNQFDEAAYLDAIATSESYHPAAIALAGKWAFDGVPYVEAMRRLAGGSLKIVAAKSPRNLRRHNVRVLLIDEADATEPGAEGSPITLAERRTLSFANRKIIIGSTPTIEETSNVLRSYARSDRRVFEVACPECGHWHEITWADIQWPEGEPERAHYVCPDCGSVVEERHKAAMVEGGRWRATAPHVRGHAGLPYPAERIGACLKALRAWTLASAPDLCLPFVIAFAYGCHVGNSCQCDQFVTGGKTGGFRSLFVRT